MMQSVIQSVMQTEMALPIYYAVIVAVIMLVFTVMLQARKGVVIQTGLLAAFLIIGSIGSEIFNMSLLVIQFLFTVIIFLRLKAEIDINSIRIMEKTHQIPLVITKSNKPGNASSRFDKLLF